ncbi:uncharacterized protein [Diabrotica undecimpunctata]|uniref:uncharacterized protein isoform X2 n=1 Tax=Diabrotica undecimpunctata TaxID=50387 RepID=UPI003B6390EC
MESDLLKKEDEFYKENEKLEQRTKELMKQVNDVMKIQDNLIKESLKTKSDIDFAKQNNFKFSNKQNCVEKVDYDKADDELGVPTGISDMGVRGATQYYKTRLTTLQGEEIKKLQKENQSFQEEKEKWFTSYNAAKSTIGKLESQVSSINSKFQGKTTELTLLKKELEQVKKDLKKSTLDLNNYDVRLTRAQEENEKLKTSLKTLKDEEKEARESFKKQISDLTLTVKHIEKHKVELLNGFKKQLQLIDNLKKQKMYLESLKIGELTESEYLKILDWKWD